MGAIIVVTGSVSILATLAIRLLFRRGRGITQP